MRLSSICTCCLIAATLIAAASASAQSYPPAWSSGSSYAVGDQVQLNGNVIRATHAVSPGGFVYADWELWAIRANTTVMVGVGQTFSSLQSAWNYVENARIAQGAYLHIYVSSAKGGFADEFTAPFNVDQGSGASISIIGDNESNDVLTFPSSNGLSLDAGHSIASVSGLTLMGSNKSIGVIATYSSVFQNLSGMIIDGFKTGIYTFQGASMFIGTNVVVESSVFGLQADYASTIVSSPIFFLVPNASGICLQADHNAVISLENFTLNGWGYGALSQEGGFIDIKGCTIGSTTIACQASYGGRINAEDSVLNGDTTSIKAFDGGTVDAIGAQMNGAVTVGTNDGSYVWGLV